MHKDILLVEDNEGDVYLFNQLLQELDDGVDYNIKPARSLARGLTLLAEHTFAVAIVDLGLPDATDLEAISAIQQRHPTIPIIVLSGQDSEAVALKAVQLGAQDYLIKGSCDGNLIKRVIAYSIERKINEQKLNRLAHYDNLTGLANRLLFKDRLERGVVRANRNKVMIALLMVDLDRFKNINDTLGHDVGDEVLVETARRFVAATRKTDTVARLGGDEFIVIMEDVDDVMDTGVVAKKLIKAMVAPFKLSNHQLTISPSIGISTYPIDDADAANLLRNADSAMYNSKRNGGNCYSFYTTEMNQKLLNNLEIESKLRRAVTDDALVLHYQPKFSVKTGALLGVEALLRWNNQGKLVYPNDFIAVAEDSDLINLISDWVIVAACRQAVAWQQQGYAAIKVAINLSPKQFKRPEPVNHIIEQITGTGLAPQYVELEITENIFIDDMEQSVAIIEQLKAQGISIAIDDFGTGYSSFNYLKQLPVDSLKIDRFFVKAIDADNDNDGMVSAIIAVAKSLNINVVAEGVETEAQINYLADKGCSELQGFLRSKPVTADELEQRFLKQSA